ncbi:hypothetical protein AJ80_08756 [Polytolypa hystricis UAMH7299]|uniref:Sld7 C-terminal domain-containing protein n=1 Tax=Polytolypa hystricis (strain UAMH7299) TaxID=1447883 RepID=A0A2B7X2Q4_POLH7|nr:hypothetical protein AJ80_08756 [Polytolypa hystricis UAMH7299]
MEVWSGSIALNSTCQSSLNGISLIDPSCSRHGQSELPKDAKLAVATRVNPALVPYYVRTGPTLEVHTSDYDTAEWLKERILCDGLWQEDADDCSELATTQCPVGLLLTVEDSRRDSTNANGPSSRSVTEILVYGILSSPSLLSSPPTKRPPTPPISSAPNSVTRDAEPHAQPEKELRLYAAPICTALITRAHNLPSPPRSPEPADNTLPAIDQEPFAEFLPDIRSPSPKRKRMASLFDAAAEYHRRVRRNGGAAVAQLMAGSRPSSSSSSSQLARSVSYPKVKKENDAEQTAFNLSINSLSDSQSSIMNTGSVNKHKPRTLSISRLRRVPSLQSPLTTAAQTPTSRPNTPRSRALSVSSRRSTPVPLLREASSLASQVPLDQSFASSTTQDVVARSQSDIIATNKALLTRTILTCMRFYGFHRNSSKAGNSSSSSAPQARGNINPHAPETEPTETGTPVPVSTSPDADDDEEEFKAMYHATYRASSFALRRYFKGPVADAMIASLETGLSSPQDLGMVLEREKAMDVVDSVLKLFCEGNG